MDEYISREAVLKAFRITAKNSNKDYQRGLQDAIDCLVPEVIADIPTADVQPVKQWISVKDRLPEIGKSVLVIVSINAKVNLPLCTNLALEMRIGWLDDNGKWGLQFDSADRDEILYWMPLPEPPKDGDAE